MRFVDTSFWVAMRYRRDTHHDTARALVQAGLGALLTTNHVLGEAWTFLNRRSGHTPAVEFLDAVAASDLAVVSVDEVTEQEAWIWLRRHSEREFSFVDATSFAVMRRRRIAEALAFDGDFTAAGFTEVRAR